MGKAHPALVEAIQRETMGLVAMTCRDLKYACDTEDEYIICLDAMFSNEGPLVWNALLAVAGFSNEEMRAKMDAAKMRRAQERTAEAKAERDEWEEYLRTHLECGCDLTGCICYTRQ